MEPLRRITVPTVDVLTALLESEDPVWGLVVIKATGRLAGTVYPILERLERQGWVRSRWDEHNDRSGPRRRLYEFTAEGRVAAQRLVDEARAAARSRSSQPTSRPVIS